MLDVLRWLASGCDQQVETEALSCAPIALKQLALDLSW
jgi:hypothetical protein